MKSVECHKTPPLFFTSDHGDMLGEFGLWYKMSFREWSCRIPMIIYNPSRFSPTRVHQPVAQVDVLPTLIDIAHEGTGMPKPEYIDPVDGRSMVGLCDGLLENDPDRAVSEYLAEGTGNPMLMIRESHYKYICCPGDPEQLFDLDNDPDELNNLVNDPHHKDRITAFREQARAHWDVELVKKQVVDNQKRRRSVHAALRIGRYQGWDYEVKRDASNEYTRSHMDLTKFDITSRYPRPAPFEPNSTD